MASMKAEEKDEEGDDTVQSLSRVITPSQKQAEHFCSYLVLVEEAWPRRVWNVVVLFLLLYTATYFPFQLCFIDLQVRADMQSTQDMLDRPVDFIVNCLFYVDLILNFFLSYKDSRGHEVVDLRMTAKYYLRTYFVPNLVACTPPQLIESLASSDVLGGADLLEVTRFSRLQRMSRLARLVRLIQLSKLIRFLDESPMVAQFRNLRGVRIVNLFCMLSWVAHMVCCGWYLCAALQTSVPWQDTWLGMRIADAEGGNLVVKGDGTPQTPEVQWLHSFYFVLTVFTTVGFGDMSAFTPAEIGYVCGTMLLGAIVNSIILNEVISTLTRLDENSTRVAQQMQVVHDFSEHCALSRPLRKQMVRWAREGRAEKHNWDRAWMRELLTNGSMPIRLVGQLPSAIFSGGLMKNRFLSVCAGKFRHGLPPRFHMLLALQLDHLDFEKDQMVYHCNDQAFSIYLVLKGIFASVALPSPHGGITENVDFLREALANQLKHVKQQRAQSFTLFLRRSMTFSRSEENSDDETLDPPKMSMLSPFYLHCEGNYFGDVEVLATPCVQRLCSVRCERNGRLLQLHKDRLQRLLMDFPDCLKAWVSQAARHEARRQSKLRNLKEPMDCFDLAKRDIERTVIDLWRKRRKGPKLTAENAKPELEKSRSQVEQISKEAHFRQTSGPENEQPLHAEVREMKIRVKEMNEQMAQLRASMSNIQASMKDVVSLLQADMKMATV